MFSTDRVFPSPFGVWVRKGVVQEPFQDERFRSRIDALVIFALILTREQFYLGSFG